MITQILCIINTYHSIYNGSKSSRNMIKRNKTRLYGAKEKAQGQSRTTDLIITNDVL